jgi:hypothetical protein
MGGEKAARKKFVGLRFNAAFQTFEPVIDKKLQRL